MRSTTIVTLMVIAAAAQEQHFIDVRELVRDTIDAIKDVPTMMENKTSSTTNAPSTTTALPVNNNMYQSLLKLPADIMSRLAKDVGFPDPLEGIVGKKSSTKGTIIEEKREEPEKVKEEETESSRSSFRTVEDEKAEMEHERPQPAKPADTNDDIFSISKLISATGNALREAQMAQQQQQQDAVTMPPLVPLPTPLEMPGLQAQTEVVYRPVVKDGKTVYEQMVLLKMADGSSKVIAQNLFEQLPMAEEKKLQIKQMKTLSKEKAVEFAVPTFPPMVNVFDPLSLPSTTQIPTTTTEEPTTTTAEEIKKTRKRLLPRRRILEKKPIDMHSRQFGAKTLQMNDPIDIQQKPEVTAVKKEIEDEEDEEVEELENTTTTTTTVEPPKKRRRLVKKSKKSELKKKEIRKFPDLYDEQWKKTQVAPSVSPPSEEFVEQFADMQQDDAIADDMDRRSSKVNEEQEEKPKLTREKVEEMLDREIHRRVLMKIRSAKTKGVSEEQGEQEEVTTTTTEVPEEPKKTKKVRRAVVTKQQCLNLRSFAKQFLFDNLGDFAREHCSFIENYYPELKCSRVEKYVEKCIKLMTKSG